MTEASTCSAADSEAKEGVVSSPSSPSLPDTFSPEAHSWIMVPEMPPDTAAGPSSAAPPHPITLPGEGETAATTRATPEPSSPPRELTTSTPGSPTMLHETGNDLVSGLAVSEILSAESAWPLPVSETSPPLPSLCDASYEPPPPAPLSGAPLSGARRLGALAFPPNGEGGGEEAGKDGSCKAGLLGCGGGARTDEEEEAESDTDAIDEFLDPLVCWGQQWARPLALVAVLLASHAACVLLGVAIGKAQSKCSEAAVAPEVLMRRFSSGATGTHARLCVA